MKISSWRIFKPKYEPDAFSGDGARQFGGRWNSKGSSVVYTAGSISLAGLELLVHLEKQAVLLSYLVVEATFDASLVTVLKVAELPANWRESPAPVEAQRIGDEWLRLETSPVLKVPSTVVPSETNYLFNPKHVDFRKIEVGVPEAFKFDQRLAT